MIWLILLLLALLPCSAQQNSFADLAFMQSPAGVVVPPIGTNGVLWYTNGGANYSIDPVDSDLSASGITEVSAVNCTNFNSLNLTDNTGLSYFFMTGCNVFTNMSAGNCGGDFGTANQDIIARMIFSGLVDSGTSNGSVDLDREGEYGITNFQVLIDRGWTYNINDAAQLLWTPYASHMSINGVSMTADEVDAGSVYNITRDGENHNLVTFVELITSVTNVDFNSDSGLSADVVTSILDGLNQAGVLDCTIILTNTAIPNNLTSYDALTNAGNIVLIDW